MTEAPLTTQVTHSFQDAPGLIHDCENFLCENIWVAMGLLKHIILPLLALVHVIIVFPILSGDKMGFAVFSTLKESTSEPLSLMESHLAGVSGAAHASLFFGCLVGVFHESSHFRGVFLAMETVFWTMDVYDGYMLGMQTAPVLALLVMCFIGLIVHSREPGIFTKDKAKTKSS
jgi:hypothetical protein